MDPFKQAKKTKTFESKTKKNRQLLKNLNTLTIAYISSWMFDNKTPNISPSFLYIFPKLYCKTLYKAKKKNNNNKL